MKIYYDEGMPIMNFSAAGTFRIGEPKEVADDLAKELLRKGRVKEWKENKEIAHEATKNTKGKVIKDS